MRLYSTNVLALSALLLGAAGSLQGQRYNFKFYGEEQGLQNLAVQVALQDQTGFLWVGTQNGLYRYDGSRFAMYGRNEGLPGSRIESLHESVEGTLWVGTGTGLGRRKGAGFEMVPLVAQGMAVAQGIVGREGIASDPAGHLYLATNRGLITGRISAGAMQFMPAAPGQDAREATSVYVDPHGTVWYGWGDSLFQIEHGTASEAAANVGLPHEKWDAILEDLDGNLWVRSAQSLYVRPKDARRFQVRIGVAEATNTFPILALDPAGRLLVPTNAGLARQTAWGWQLIDANEGLNTNDISAVVQDREGSIWLGLLGSGLARWLGYNEWQSWSDHEGLSRESVWSVARDTSGRMWVGTQFGLNYAQEQDGRQVWKPRPIAGVDMIRALAAGADGTLWIGGDPGGLALLDTRSDPASGTLRHFGPQEGMIGNSIRHVMVDRRGRVWVSARRGLFRGERSKDARGRPGTAWHFEQIHPPGTQASEGFTMTAEDAHGNVWVCGDLGLARMEAEKDPRADEKQPHADEKPREKEQWTRFTVQDGLKANMTAQVLAETDGSVWIGYRDAYGLSHLSFDSSRVETGSGTNPPRLHIEHLATANSSSIASADNGLRSDKTVFLGFDSRRRLWLGTDHGVDVFDHARWHHYGRSEGLIWDDCNSNAFYGGPGGEVWIGTSRGLSRFLPQSVPAPGVPPPVVFTSVKFGDRLFTPGMVLDLPYQERSLQVRLAALTFAQESNVVFRYHIVGVQPKWLDTTDQVLNYPTLPPGRFTLEVMARNAQGVWSAEPARLTFQIRPAWWLTWWFRVACSIAGMAMFLVWWPRRTRRQEAERFRLEAAVVARTRELSLEKARVLEEKARAEQENIVVQKQKFEIERLLREAQQSNRFKSEFLANMSHEIRTPMNGILGMTDLALSMPLAAEQRDYLETARFSADSLLTLLNDILDFSKIEAGRLDLSPIPFSVRECLDQVAKMFAVPLEAKKLAYSAQVAEDVPAAMMGDPDRLRQILLNLIGNAIKFTEQGSIRVAIRRVRREAAEGSADVHSDAHSDAHSDVLHFSVTDTGIGIPADKKDLIFEAFRQAGGSMTRKYGGTGLGLTICSRLVELMGGAIGVDSAPGQGSTFHFTARFGHTDLDAQSGRGLRSLMGAVNGKMPPSNRSLDILLAEDHVVNQRLATRLLEKRGHRVVVAASGGEALERLEEQSFDVILMDLQMPDMDGLETTARIRERENGSGVRTPIVALTAHSMKGDRERCLAAGMDDYIAKPINPGELIMVVEAAVATASEREAAASQAVGEAG